MKKRKVVVVVLLTLVALMGVVTTGLASSSDPITWWGWTPGSPMNEQYIAEFNKEYPDIEVNWKQVKIADYDAAIRPALASGQGVDALQVSAGSANGGIAVYAGQVIDMNNAIKNILGDDYKDKVSKVSIESMTVNGQLKGIGVGSVYAGNLWINQDLFDKYNVKVPTNMDEWVEAVKAFEEHDIIGFVQGANQGAFNMDTFHAIADNVSPGTFTKAARGKVKWTNESIVKALELWKDLFDKGIMQPGALGIQQYPEANNLFMSQKAAMVMMGSWYTMNTLPDVMQSAINAASSTEEPFTMIPIDFPDIAGTGHTGSMFGDLDYATAVAKNSDNIKDATTFALWLGTSQKGQKMIANSLNLIPALKSVTPDWNKIKLVNPEKQNEAIKEYINKAMDSGDNYRFADINADMNQVMMDVLAGVASGMITPEKGAAQLESAQANN